MGKKYSFERLEVYQDARSYVGQVYGLTNIFPEKERYALSMQLQRAAISVISNSVEGTSRSSDKEKSRFIEIAYGSLLETYCQLQVAQDLQYISHEKLNELQLNYIDKIANKLSALKKHYTLHTTH